MTLIMVIHRGGKFVMHFIKMESVTPSSAEVIMIIKCQVLVSSLLLNIPKAKKKKITSAE